MIAPIVVALLAVTDVTTSERPSLLVTDLTHSDDVKPDVARTLSELVTAEFARDDAFRVMSGADLRNLVALEGEKQAMGCESDQSCLAEVAGALGARFVVFGRVSTLDHLYVLQLNLMDAKTGIALARVVGQAESVSKFASALPTDCGQLLAKAHDVLDKEAAAAAAAHDERARAEALAQAARTTTAVVVTPAPEPPPPEESSTPLLLMAGGGTLAVAGVLAGGVLALTAGALLAMLYDPGFSKDVRGTVRLGVWAALGFLPVALVVAAVGVGGVGASFFLE